MTQRMAIGLMGERDDPATTEGGSFAKDEFYIENRRWHVAGAI